MSPVDDNVDADRQGIRYCFIAVRVHEILHIRLEDEPRSDLERVIPFQRHLELLSAERRVPLNFLRPEQISTVRGVDHSKTRKILWAAAVRTISDQPCIEKIRDLIHTLVRRGNECAESAQVTVLFRVTPTREDLITQGI